MKKNHTRDFTIVLLQSSYKLVIIPHPLSLQAWFGRFDLDGWAGVDTLVWFLQLVALCNVNNS